MKQRRLFGIPFVWIVTVLLCAWTAAAVAQAPAPADSIPSPAPVAPAAVAPEAAPAAAQPAPEPVTPAPAEKEAEAINPAPAKGVVEASGNKDLINVAVDNETLENVVNMFTRITGANIVATATNLGGTVTVNLKDVEWKAALGSILDLHGLALTEKMPGSEVYSIVNKPPIESQPLVVETIFLKYTTSTELKPVLMSAMASATNAMITELASRNALVVKTTEPNLRELKSLVQAMDIPSKQVCVEAKFVELSDEASKQLGIRWDSLAAFGVGLSAGPFTYNRDTTDTKQSSQERTTVDARSDVDQTKQLYRSDGSVYEEVRTEFVEAPPGSGQYLAQSTVTPTRQREYGTEQSDRLQTSDLDTFTRNIAQSQAAVLSMDSLNLVLSALKKTDGAQVVSNPKIIVTSGSTNAWFSVGGREPIIKVETKDGTQDSPGDKRTAQLDTDVNTDYIKEGYLQTGIQLQVLPVVKTDNMIETAIMPKLVRLVGYTDPIDGNKWPIIDVKEISTKFTLRSGQTVAIGGLTDTRDSKKTTKVPLLGDIPLIGKYLFSHEADVKKQTETIIFVTLSKADPETLRDNEGLPDNTELLHKRMIQNKLHKEELDEELKQLEQVAEDQRAKKARARALRK